MEPLKEFSHIDLKWEKDPYKNRVWHLQFDDDVLCSIKQGGWFFNRYQFVESHAGEWRIKKKGNDPYLYEFKRKNLVGQLDFEIGFKKRYSVGMFNPTRVDNFNWHKLDGNAKGMGWHQDSLEVVRFEKVNRSFSKFNYAASIVNGRVEEKWLVAMLISGFLALK